MEEISLIRQRKQYSVEFKLNAVKLLETNLNNIRKTSISLNVDRKTLRRWKNQKFSLLLCNKKRTAKKTGCGRKSFFPITEKQLSLFIDYERKVHKRVITRRRLLERARVISKNIYPNFKGTYSWVSRFLKRNNYCFRKITHTGQMDNDTFEEIRNKILEHLNYISFHTKNLATDQIYNMDETPGFFDMISPTTITFKGEKNVEALTTGHEHSRFTVVLCIRMDGKIIKTLIIFKGLKRVPKLILPNDIFVTVSDGGSMNENIMLSWLENCFGFQKSSSLLVMDNYSAHTVPNVLNKMNEYNTKIFLLPARTTHYTQPLDVGINGPFKTSLRNEWENWFAKSTPIFTPKGYRKSPTYQDVVNFVHSALKTISKESISKSFYTCGISEQGRCIPSILMNERLKKIVENGNDTELSLSYELEEEIDGVGAVSI